MLLVLFSLILFSLLMKKKRRQARVGNRKLTTLVQDIKDDADEPLSEICEHKVRACQSDRLQHAAGSAVLYHNPQTP
jgi:hypothetical protein